MLDCTPKIGHGSNLWGVFHGTAFLSAFFMRQEFAAVFADFGSARHALRAHHSIVVGALPHKACLMRQSAGA
jgi:hypothetical protein